MNDELRAKLTKFLTEEVGIDVMKETLVKLALEAETDHDEQIWLQALGILVIDEIEVSDA